MYIISKTLNTATQTSKNNNNNNNVSSILMFRFVTFAAVSFVHLVSYRPLLLYLSVLTYIA